jgi:hypothetical protein
MLVHTKMSFQDANRDPKHWCLLSDTDKEVYFRIRSVLSAPSSRNKRKKQVDDFKEILDAIDIFINRDEQDKWKRCLVCGVCRLSNGIAVNPLQLQRLIFKCKSSINNCLRNLGYDSVAKPSMNEELFQQIPLLRHYLVELRQWTVRTNESPTETWSNITPPAAVSGVESNAALELRGSVPKESPVLASPPQDFTEFLYCDSFSDFLFDF